MKSIQAIIRPAKLDEVKEALAEIGVKGLNVTEIRGFGRTGGRKEVYRGSAYVVDFVPKLKLEVVAPDDQVLSIIEVIERSAKSGKIGDGKIFIVDVLDVVRIRTGEHGEEAI
jgi:nitrogen regulatory protein P-II 1